MWSCVDSSVLSVHHAVIQGLSDGWRWFRWRQRMFLTTMTALLDMQWSVSLSVTKCLVMSTSQGWLRRSCSSISPSSSRADHFRCVCWEQKITSHSVGHDKENEGIQYRKRPGFLQGDVCVCLNCLNCVFTICWWWCPGQVSTTCFAV